jgi:hypothetical protein
MLNQWERLAVENDDPIQDSETMLASLKKVIDDDALAEQVRAIVAEYNASKSVGAVQLPSQAYTRVRRRLLAEGME